MTSWERRKTRRLARNEPTRRPDDTKLSMQGAAALVG